ncbi:MAG: LLM class flavin-dependent oxidoreductase [Gammaproteobacteria bacterium]
MKLRLGALCLFENPTGEDGRALIRQFVLVREADRMGFDDIWLAECADDPAHPSTAIEALVGHLAGVTSKARIGAVVQPSRHEAEALAQSLATASLLSRGRLALAADARGAHTDATASLAALQARLAGQGGPLIPAAPGVPVPAWAVVDSAEAARQAAARGLGLWLPAELDEAAVEALIAAFREAGGSADPGVLLARFACPAATREAALALAQPFAHWRAGADAAPAMLARSLVGSHAEVAQALRHLGERFGLLGVIVVPMSAGFDDAKHILADMVDEVRPLLDD